MVKQRILRVNSKNSFTVVGKKGIKYIAGLSHQDYKDKTLDVESLEEHLEYMEDGIWCSVEFSKVDNQPYVVSVRGYDVREIKCRDCGTVFKTTSEFEEECTKCQRESLKHLMGDY